MTATRLPLPPEEAAPRRFPLQPTGSIPWSVAEVAYTAYVRRYGRSQSLDRLAARGGFGHSELIELLEQAAGDGHA
jgi:hypothetical protein